MANDRRDRDDMELGLQLQELEVGPEPLAMEGRVEQRMMAAVSALEDLPMRERLGVLTAMLPAVLEQVDGVGRQAILEELFRALNAGPAA